MKEVNIYGVYDGEYLIFKGTRHEICNEFRIRPTGFYEYAKGSRRLRGKFDVCRINGDEPIQQRPEPIFKSMEEEHFDYLYSMLRIYGNTCSVFNPEPYMKKLKNKGIMAEFRDSPFGGYYIEVVA